MDKESGRRKGKLKRGWDEFTGDWSSWAAAFMMRLFAPSSLITMTSCVCEADQEVQEERRREEWEDSETLCLFYFSVNGWNVIISVRIRNFSCHCLSLERVMKRYRCKRPAGKHRHHDVTMYDTALCKDRERERDDEGEVEYCNSWSEFFLWCW